MIRYRNEFLSRRVVASVLNIERIVQRMVYHVNRIGMSYRHSRHSMKHQRSNHTQNSYKFRYGSRMYQHSHEILHWYSLLFVLKYLVFALESILTTKLSE